MQEKVSLHGPDHPDFILDDYPLYNLNRTSATYTQQTTERLKDLDMDQPSWRILMLLGDKNPSTVGELSRRSVTKISTITRILIRMENDGLIIRKPFPDDNRVIEVFITEKGTGMLSDLRALASDVYKKAFIGIEEDDIIKFTNILMQVRQNLSE
ncbi:MarR family winged helix-turn-helix transcriptional regulator [Pseudemcibacter aquimaris]|uniref:MarR family winged helix-turn-helix transcriptional regulator n=1 Tax=Pseudemcibacter aquimaris TaxID=2857064 RepID=UPI002012A37C|nr:MarR family transcriptional regulator [Pseudemcibacter aquimaris]MCC3861557.1 MarR family transcriptional regulator [Pseudemcibacter aquimaris]WDU58326.1 MarR family transcriptional regulator [Pseudemcibacter aquimaris]